MLLWDNDQVFTEITDMLVFAAVARAGSLTRAGQALGLPKSTVSRRIASLEERVGSRLMHKTTRRLVLTDAGEAFLEHCQKLADEADEALSFAGELSSEPRGVLRVTMPPDLSDRRLHDAIKSFIERYPSITLELDESQRYVDLTAERVDVALRAGVLEDSGLVARRLCELKGGPYASPSYLKKHGTPKVPKDLADHPFIVLRGRVRFDHFELSSGEERAQVELPSRVTATTGGMQQNLAIAGAGLAMLPESFAGDAVQARQLVRLLPKWTLSFAPLWIVTPSRRLLPRKTVLFIEHLMASFN